MLTCDAHAWSADANGDGYWNIPDMAVIVGSFGQSVPGAAAGPDGFVDITDVAHLASRFGESTSL